MSAITRRQRDVLDFIEAFVEKERFNPTFQEIADGLGLKSLATVHKHVTNLRNNGFIKHVGHGKRGLEITTPDVLEARFRFEGPDRLWDNVANCYWVKERTFTIELPPVGTYPLTKDDIMEPEWYSNSRVLVLDSLSEKGTK